jgi:hypothetical protein
MHPIPRSASWFAFVAFAGSLSAADSRPAISYVGNVTADSRADGGLQPVIGVHNIQVYRANRTASEHADGLTDTYTHQAMLAFWRGKFWLEYLSGPRDEHQAPCSTSLTTSVDGLAWEKPRTVFPAFKVADGRLTVMHQRMGLHVAASGRLLALGFHGLAPSPNDGTGIGRVVREVREDGSFGPIHFIKFNKGWDESNTPYPLYKKSADATFVADCDALLANKVLTQQWWEEDSAKEQYPVTGKAMSFFTRKDGAKVAIWKNRLTSVITENGAKWTPHVFAGNMPNNASKYWLQRTADGRVALVLNPTDRLRHPLAVMSSDDDEHFDRLLAIHGELPDQRFPGGYKNMGPQYVRGIVEGNGTAPGTAMWLAYTVNKEDVWVSRVPVPLRSAAEGSVNDAFEVLANGTRPAEWNIYQPKWAAVQVVDRAFELRDEEPFDYARATRVFPATRSTRAKFKLLAQQANARLEIEFAGAKSERPVRLALTEKGRLSANHEGIWLDLGEYPVGKWMACEVDINPGQGVDRFDFYVDGKMILPRAGVFTEPAKSVERVSFRTGAFRDRGFGGVVDTASADRRAPAAVFRIDDVVLAPR